MTSASLVMLGLGITAFAIGLAAAGTPRRQRGEHLRPPHRRDDARRAWAFPHHFRVRPVGRRAGASAMSRARALMSGSGLPGGQSRMPLILAATLVLAACAATQAPDAVATAAATPGFWLGVWHGFIFPVAWIVSLFADKVAVYAVPNTGGWYDFGYFVGIVFLGVGARKSRIVRVRGR